MSSKVAIVVLNYKGLKDTLECIKSLQKQTYKNLHLVIVENGSYDGSDAKLQQLESDQITVMCNDKNLGFAGGVNTGIRWALANDYDYIALFNNDAVADKGWAKKLVHSAEKHRSGITTGLLLTEDGKRIDSTSEQYSIWGLAFPRNRGHKKNESPSGEFVFGATGGASIYSAEMLRRIGLFDEDFFAYYEDVDISFRAQLAGWKVYYEPGAIAYHKLGQTSARMRSGFAVYQTFKNLPIVFIKNVPARLILPIGVRFMVAYWLMLGHAIARGNGLPALRGMLMSVFYKPKKLIQRWIIQQNKKVSTDYIKSVLWNDLPPEQTGLRKLFRR